MHLGGRGSQNTRFLMTSAAKRADKRAIFLSFLWEKLNRRNVLKRLLLLCWSRTQDQNEELLPTQTYVKRVSTQLPSANLADGIRVTRW